MRFYGRQEEISELNTLLTKKSASLVVIRGRRRIGKSQLIAEFAQGKTFYKLEGIAPTSHTTAASQRQLFATQLEQLFRIKPDSESWLNLFSFLAEQTKKQKAIILLDEISWMGSLDPDFLGILKHAWDNHFKQNPHLILILCGSVSVWIEKNILANTGFVGRFSLKLTLKELPLYDCEPFFSG